MEEMEELRRWNNTTVGLVGLNRMKRPTNWTSSPALEASTYMRQLISLFKSLYSRPMLEIKFFSKQNSFFYAFEQLILSKKNSFFSDINNGYIFRRNKTISLYCFLSLIFVILKLKHVH